MTVTRSIEIEEFKRLVELAVSSSNIISNLFSGFSVAQSDRLSVRLHLLCSDGVGRPNIGELVKALAGAILQYCIPRTKLLQARDNSNNNDFIQIGMLHNDARSMFTDLENSGEGGELLLYLLCQNVLKYTQAVSKMSLKTSSQVHFHGLDGIYTSVCPNKNQIRLHYGESKLHDNFANALRECMASISPMLDDQGGLAKSKRDLFLINNHSDLGDPDLTKALINFLDPQHEDYMSHETCAVLLVGFNVNNYPRIKPKAKIDWSVIEKLRINTNLIDKNISKNGIGNFHINLFLLPFESVGDFRSNLKTAMGL